MGGFFRGLVLGGVAVVVTAVVISLMAPPPQSPDLATGTAPVSAPAGNGGQEPTTPLGRDGDVVEIAPTPPEPESGGDDLAALQDSDTTPAARPSVSGATDPLTEPGAAGPAPAISPAPDDAAPVSAPDATGGVPQAPGATDTSPTAEGAPQRPSVGGATSGLDTPASSGTAPDVSAIAEPPAVPNPAGGLSAPEAGSGSISVDPAQPAPPEIGTSEGGLATAPETGASPEVSAGTDPVVSGTEGAGSGAMETPGAQDAPATALAPAADPSTVAANPAQPSPDAQDDRPAVAGTEEPAVTPSTEAPAPSQPAPAPAQPPTPEPAEPPAPRIAALPQSGTGAEADTGPKIGTRVRPLTERGQKNTFLPASGAGSDGVSEEARQDPPIRRFSAAFENPEAKPLMSIVLIDDTQSVGVEALQEFPYPLTFAISPSDPLAIEKLARHRAAGFEVALLTDLPSAANAQDAEVSLGAALSALPETVAILEGTGSGIQGNRQLSDQVAAIALGTGRGLVTQRNGLNTAQKLAARKGVPSAVVFRDFDGAGQSTDTIRRFLDQAAFRADQEGAVVMLGRVRPDTISALLLWGLQDRASRVALAPLSAALLREPQN